MNKQITFLAIITLSLVLIAAPAFAQGKGVGAGVGAGNQARVGGGNAHADAPGIKGGSASDVNAKSKASGVKTPADKIEANPQLSAKLQPLLPAGESFSHAAAGFKNQGQFIAALHVSHNLNIPFDQLKAKMTGDDAKSLGAAIKASRPNLTAKQAKEEAEKAEKQAKETQKG